MWNPFRLFIFAVAALALLYIFFTYFAPLYFWPKNPVVEMNEMLERAELDLGDSFSEEILFKSGNSISGEALDTGTRSVVFNCNNLGLCCEKGESSGCNKAVRWDERLVSFKELKKINVTARCRFEELYICKIYIGKKPAQLKLQNIGFPEEVDLSKEKVFAFNVVVKNIGKEYIAENIGSLNGELFRIYIANGEEVKEFMGKSAPILFSLAPNEEKTLQGSILVEEPGNYELYVKVVEGIDETNYDESTVNFEAVGEVKFCVIEEKRIEIVRDIETNLCKIKYYCVGCRYAFECRDLWRTEIGKELFAESPKYASELVMPVDGECAITE